MKSFGLNRMLDYARAIHSLPGCPARVKDQDDMYGPDWNRPLCDCKVYVYEHAGCPGPAAQHLPHGWKSGDDPKENIQ